MIPGGIADKLGNRYEAKWLVLRLMDVLNGNAEWLQFESIDTGFQGFEFSVRTGATTEWHQTKMSSPGGNWTIGALAREGVLSVFADRLSKDPQSSCHFVSQDNASHFRKLSEKARTSNDVGQFLDILSGDQRDAFEQLRKNWCVESDVARSWLRRCHVETISEATLGWTIQAFGDLYFLNGGTGVYPNLRDIAEEHFNKELNGQSLRSAIRAKGTLTIKEWALDPTVPDKLKDATKSYLGTYTPFGVGGETIGRSEAASLVSEVVDAKGANLILLTGVAGSGKSGVVRAALSELAERQIPHLAFRVDQCLHCGTREELGRHVLGRNEGPTSTLKGAFPLAQSVLFIDQLDAISEVSGREGKVREVIFQLISDAEVFGGVKVVVACRTFDLESDARLKRLKESHRVKQIDVSLLKWANDVAPILEKKGFPVDKLSEPQRRLLELPVNLAIFLEIDEPGLAFSSRSNLHERLIEKKQRVISRSRQPSWTVVRALAAMCDWMSKRQQLDAPLAVLDPFAGAADILSSEGLIVVSRGRVNFFHESFFDHVFARAFLLQDHSLVDMLAETEQHLFRRTQVRQILDALRQNDFTRYVEELSSLLASDTVRFHIKYAVSQWLTTIESPTEQEFQIIEPLDNGLDGFGQLFRKAALSTHVWFDLLSRRGWIQNQLGRSERRVNVMLWWLSNIAGDRPREIADLLRSWWNRDPEKASHLIGWFGFTRRQQPDDDLLQLCCDVVEAHPAELFTDRDRDRIAMILHTWGEQTPEKCGQLLKSIFDAWFKLHPGQNPFETDQKKIVQDHSLDELLKKAPRALVVGVTDALVTLVDLAIGEGREGANWYQMKFRTQSRHRFGFDLLIATYVEALKKVAEKDPIGAIDFLGRIDPLKHECFMHIHLEVIQSNPAALSSRLPALAKHPLALEAGWHGADWLSLASACRACFAYLSEGQRREIETHLFSRNKELEYAREAAQEIAALGETRPFRACDGVRWALNQSGLELWSILETIGEGALTEQGKQRLAQLRRKFPRRAVEQPSAMDVYQVGSPIKRRQCERMSDAHWLAAIKHYDNDEERRRGPGFVDGGARQLAGELQEATKKDPRRFSALMLQIPATAHKAYVEHVLWGLAEAESPSDDALIAAVRHGHQFPDTPYGREIARIVQKHPHLTELPDICDMLIWYAQCGEANESDEAERNSLERETLTIDHLIQRGGGLHIRGLNGVRGWAWEALGTVLWNVPQATEKIWSALEHSIKHEKLIGVRCCMMRVLTPLFNADKKRFEASLRTLIGMERGALVEHHQHRLAPLITHTGVRLFPYVLHWLPDFGRELMHQLLTSGDRTKELIGAWIVFGESFRHAELVEDAERLSAQSIEHRRLLADVTGDVLTWAEQANRAESLLRAFFFDDDKEVRQHAADAFRRIKPGEVERYRDLTEIFLKSPAYAEHGHGVLHMIEHATCDVLDLVIEAARSAVASLSKNGDRNGSLSMHFHTLQDMLKREYVSSERNPAAREKILNMIDEMLSREVYGAENIVAAHDRW